jgi:hypothetical protein
MRTARELRYKDHKGNERIGEYHVVMSMATLQAIPPGGIQRLFSRIFLSGEYLKGYHTGLPRDGILDVFKLEMHNSEPMAVIPATGGDTFLFDGDMNAPALYLQFRDLAREYEKLRELESEQDALTEMSIENGEWRA